MDRQRLAAGELVNELIYPHEPFVRPFVEYAAFGRERLHRSKVAVVGLARNCAVRLSENLGRLSLLTNAAREWCLHIETNDNTDQTVQVLTDYCREYRQATFTSQTLGRQQFTAEFAGPRTIALAEYRTACQEWVRECAADADYVIVVDWDQWGGWSHDGLLAGLGWLLDLQGAYGMASISLFQFPGLMQNNDNTAVVKPTWMHYDAWALRLNSYWDDYRAGRGGWKHQFLPPVGSPPIRVCSAFGGLAIYRTSAYLAGTYDGKADCEHVTFHESVADATGQGMYLCPSMRCVMSWMTDGQGHHGDH